MAGLGQVTAPAIRPALPTGPTGGLAGGAGTLGGGPMNPLAGLFARQLAQHQPGGAGTPFQQAQGGMGGLGSPLGALQGPVGAQQGATTVPGTIDQTPFGTPSNAPNAAQTQLKSGGGMSAGLGSMPPQLLQALIAHFRGGGMSAGPAAAPAAGSMPAALPIARSAPRTI